MTPLLGKAEGPARNRVLVSEKRKEGKQIGGRHTASATKKPGRTRAHPPRLMDPHTLGRLLPPAALAEQAHTRPGSGSGMSGANARRRDDRTGVPVPGVLTASGGGRPCTDTWAAPCDSGAEVSVGSPVPSRAESCPKAQQGACALGELGQGLLLQGTLARVNRERAGAGRRPGGWWVQVRRGKSLS